MIAPWLIFVFVTLGLLAGGGVEILAAPTDWVVRGTDAVTIMRAQTCAVNKAGALVNERLPGT